MLPTRSIERNMASPSSIENERRESPHRNVLHAALCDMEDRVSAAGLACYMAPSRKRRIRPKSVPLATPSRMDLTTATKATTAKSVKQALHREDIVEQLIKRIDQAKQEGRIKCQAPTELVAKRLESALFRSSASLEQHLNIGTLDSRLRRIVHSIEAKQHKKKIARGQDSSQPKPPTDIHTHHHIKVLQAQAQFYKFSWANQTKCGMPMPWLQNDAANDRTFPEPMKRLFFHTRLLSRTASTMGETRDHLIAEAEANLKDYQEWACQNLPSCSIGVSSGSAAKSANSSATSSLPSTDS